MTIRGWDAELALVAMPKGVQTAQGAAGDLTTNSAPFTVPKGAHALTIHCPTTGSAATLAIQTLRPGDDDQTAEAWGTISSASGVTLTPLTGIVASALAVTYSIVQIGGGVLRFVASSDQSAAPYTIRVAFHMLP